MHKRSSWLVARILSGFFSLLSVWLLVASFGVFTWAKDILFKSTPPGVEDPTPLLGILGGVFSFFLACAGCIGIILFTLLYFWATRRYKRAADPYTATVVQPVAVKRK